MARKTFVKPLKTAHQSAKPPKDSLAAKDRSLAALLESRTIVAVWQRRFA